MAETITMKINKMEDVQWMWQSNSNPWSKTEAARWSPYADIDNFIIEAAYSKNEEYVKLDGYVIDLKNKVQISRKNEKNQRPIQRTLANKEDKHMREDRFISDPIAPHRRAGAEYGWVSPFIIEVRKYLELEPEQLPSKNKTIVPIIVEKAAAGIIEEGKTIGKPYEAEKLSQILLEQKDKDINQVWTCCAYLYSMESFLYKKLNETMRPIGNHEHEKIWQSKIRTLGPFCLLLWDNPFNTKLTTGKVLFRVGKLTEKQISIYKDLAKNPEEYRSFQAFTSCSRDSHIAEKFPSANVLFIMEIAGAFCVDLKPISLYPEEEEELITPGVCFTVKSYEFDATKKKHIIYLILKQRFSQSEFDSVTNGENTSSNNDPNSLHLLARVYDLDGCDLTLLLHYRNYFSRRVGVADLSRYDRDGLII
ncbi:unnamed protein product [Rotaria sp. Silwood1]|nr:unnamed protein product [Rotaria sp. Silwood1]